ncbi:hypothetical protein PK35_06585 [Tamlana nanhaiensis]|uniref:N-acetyltransferase domain-containing protein n=1 Tax=Neotamlana nanhaiensis TaxID=1382798 RepID=A0A0D7W340_9FLAO|nr:GNAT family N-acetyltransferase [Tamlana nanhaiensis]KJD33511.1 hypothetical protein PK35_06585 [Tamlana nanhaiensis]
MNSSNYTLKTITPEASYTVRHPVLRPGKPFETCIFDGDTLSTTYHFGIYENETLLGICSCFKNNHNDLSDSSQYQLRGMAVLSNQQGKGLGKLVLNYAEDFVKNLGTTTIWCNAREVATNFYVNNGYTVFGKAFEIESIGTHYKMFKKL